MTQTMPRTSRPVERGEDRESVDGRIPSLTGDIRHLIPPLGLREYWYPLCGARKISKKKPLRIRMLGEDLCVFRGGSGNVVALTDICPHRGARLSEGDCHYEGTIACPYHGWVWDETGTNVAVLSEGPGATVCGKPGTEARKFPTQEVKGIVFVWMGEGEPAPIEEDVPEEFFRDDIRIYFNDRIYWKTNWEVALENSMDSHVQYLHRDNLAALLNTEGVSVLGGSAGIRPRFTGNGFTYDASTRRVGAPTPHKQDVYPQGWKWPKHLYRRSWASLFGWFLYTLRVKAPSMKDPDKWVGGHHLPGLFRAGASTVEPPKPKGILPIRMLKFKGLTSLYGLYTRQCVPVDEWETRMWYHHSVVVKNPLQAAWAWFVYFTWGRWSSEYNFSQQDMSVMLNQRFDAPEKLSGTDAEVVQWRKLVVTKHFGGRNATFVAEHFEGMREPEQAPMVNVTGAG